MEISAPNLQLRCHGAVGDKDKPITFCGQEIKGQCHDKVSCDQESTLGILKVVFKCHSQKSTSLSKCVGRCFFLVLGFILVLVSVLVNEFEFGSLTTNFVFINRKNAGVG